MLPTLLFLVIAYQLQNKKGRYFFLALALANLIFNIFNHTWVQEIYSGVIALLLYTLNPFFLSWWHKRNFRNNPSSFTQFVKDTFLIAKHNKFEIFSWLGALILAIAAICFFTGYTGNALLGWLMAIFIGIYILKKLFYAMLPPEWFLHDVSTGYVFLAVFIAWGVSDLMLQKLGTNFILPMCLAALFCLIGFHYIRDNKRYLIPGCALVLADIGWQIVRFIQNNPTLTPQDLLTEVLLIVAMLIGLIWLLKKPGILPIIYLALFQLFRFTAFTYQAIDRITYETLTTPEVTYYILYLVCWMYIVPLIFWFNGLIQQKPNCIDPDSDVPTKI